MVEHVTVYRQEGKYAGWPANYGIWSWDDEIVVGFTLGYHQSDAGFHTRDRSRPFVTMQARSLDGGKTWSVQNMPCQTPGDRGLSADEHVQKSLEIGQSSELNQGLNICNGDINFAHPDFALMCARTGLAGGAVSWFYTSIDRCHTWAGPYRLPMFGFRGIAARTDYLVTNQETCSLFLTAAKSDDKEGRVFCARTSDGGKSFHLLSEIGEEPSGFEIMPASIRLSESRILVAVRTREENENWEEARNYIDLYVSEDDGHSWQYLDRPVQDTGVGGNPPTMTKLRDGRLCITYGYRDTPYSILAKISDDNGITWGTEIVIRDDGGSHDIGYPRTIQRTDGSIVTVYYFADEPDGPRYIASTIWRA